MAIDRSDYERGGADARASCSSRQRAPAPGMAARRDRRRVLVPFLVADQLGLQRDLYLVVYVVAVVGLFVGWARDTSQSLREMFTRHWRLAVGLARIIH
jgi:hypothetical protein